MPQPILSHTDPVMSVAMFEKKGWNLHCLPNQTAYYSLSYVMWRKYS